MNSMKMACVGVVMGVIQISSALAVESISVSVRKETGQDGKTRISAYIRADGSQNIKRESVTLSGVLRLYKNASDDPAEEIPVSQQFPVAKRENLDRSILIKELPAHHPYARGRFSITVSAPKGLLGQSISDKTEGDLTLSGSSHSEGQPGRASGIPLFSDKPASFDRILLKNGDLISGMVQNDALSIKTSYASLPFSPDKLASIEFEGAGANLDMIVLRVGDKMSGVLETPKIKVSLTAGGEAEIDRDKIKAIRFREKPGN